MNSPQGTQFDDRTPRQPDFDELYDVTDDEVEEVPLRCSVSIMRDSRLKNRYPSLVIPSPSAWPTIQNYRKAGTFSIEPTPTAEIPMSPAMLSLLESYTLQVPSSAAPSLDGSMTSEEMASMSCPATPDAQLRTEKNGEWDPPLQLHPEAMETLHQLSGEDTDQPHMMMDQVIEVPDTDFQEMQEVRRFTGPFGGIDIVVTPSEDYPSDPLSALTVPSPGGFFSSLGDTTRQTWASADTEQVPSTSTAERFYDVPWRMSVNNSDDTWSAADDTTVRDTASRQESYLSEDGWSTPRSSVLRPVVSRQESYASTDIDEVAEIERKEDPAEYSEYYQQKLAQGASVNLDRTNLWLASQTDLAQESEEQDTVDEEVSPSQPKHGRKHSKDSSVGSPSKKSVRFADEAASASPKDRVPSASDSTFYKSFQHLQLKAKKSDAFITRQARAEAVTVGRLCTPENHRKQLVGRYELSNPSRPVISRPISNFYPTEPAEEKDLLIQAEKNWQALGQIQHSSWNLQAIKMLNGGKLLSSPALKMKQGLAKTRILDLGGQTTCDWAWQMAIENREAAVYTVTDKPAPTKLRGPSNHRVIVVEHLFKLPFPDNTFDVISARSLSTFLKVYKPTGHTADEYDLCLSECMRCLKPGGYLEFSLMDADLINAGRLGSAVSVEFRFNLKTRGYDPMPTKGFIPRLSKAGFEEIKRAWVVLPMAQPGWKKNAQELSKPDLSPEKVISPEGEVNMVEKPATGSTADASLVTGVVGAWAWEKWMLKLQMEMGRDEERLLEGVSAALEEGGQRGSGWKSLTGWARKPVA